MLTQIIACMVINSNTPDRVDLVRTPALSSVLLSITCSNVVHILLEITSNVCVLFTETHIHVYIMYAIVIFAILCQ